MGRTTGGGSMGRHASSTKARLRHRHRRSSSPEHAPSEHPPSTPRLQVVRTGRRWWNAATKTVVSLGAVASAVGAVLALWPSPDPQDRADLAVELLGEVPLTEFEARYSGDLRGLAGAPRSAPAVRLVATTAQPTETGAATPGTPEPSGSPTPDASSPGTPSTTTGESSSEATLTPTPERDELLRTRVRVPNLDGITAADTERVLEQATDELPALDACGEDAECVRVMLPIVSSLPPTGSEGAEPDQTALARDLVRLLDNVRSTGDAEAGEPLGVVATANLQLAGLRRTPVDLTWEIWQQSGDTRLLGRWLDSVTAYRLEATTELDSGSVDFWVPLPKQPGPYVIRTRLVKDGAVIASATSEPFD